MLIHLECDLELISSILESYNCFLWAINIYDKTLIQTDNLLISLYLFKARDKAVKTLLY